LSRDPIGEDGGVNLYAFILNTPLSRIDAFGLKGTKIIGEWFREPYIENFNSETTNWRFTFELSGKKIEGARVAYFDVELTADVGFTIYCQELCGDKEVKYWYIQGRVENASKTIEDIPVVVGPAALKLWNLMITIENNARKIDYWMELFLDAYPKIMEGPQAVCEASAGVL